MSYDIKRSIRTNIMMESLISKAAFVRLQRQAQQVLSFWQSR